MPSYTESDISARLQIKLKGVSSTTFYARRPLQRYRRVCIH